MCGMASAAGMRMEAFPLGEVLDARFGHAEAVARVAEDLVVEVRAQERVEVEAARPLRVPEVGEAEAIPVRPEARVDVSAMGMAGEQGDKGDDDRQEHELAHGRPLTVFTNRREEKRDNRTFS